MSKTFLYRRMACAVIGIVIGGAVVAQPSAAQNRPQLKRPHDEEPEQRPVEVKKKKVKGPRAIAVLQLSGSKATLIPVAIQVDGKFFDAGAYKADPVPMALENGTVYEGERAGESQGLFTTAGVLHSKSAIDGSAWIGTGAYYANGTEAAKTTRQAENVPVGMDSSGDEPPRLTRKSGGGADSRKSGSAPEKQSADAPAKGDEAKKAGSPSGEAGGSGDKKDPAKKSDPAQSSTGASQGKEQEPAKAASAEKGSGAAKEDKAQEEGSYYRPTLRRGKPTQAAPTEDDVSPKASAAAGATPSSGVDSAKPVQMMVAISDGGGPQPQSYKLFWKEGEEEERRKQMLTLAGEEVRAYISARTKGAIGVKPQSQSKSGGSVHKAAKPVEPIFENIQFQAFDLWKNNQPVMILSAEAHFAGDADGALSPEPYSITLVSRTDIYGSLRKLYSGVTDKFHLDVTPRLELVDAVDADGDGRGELLFRESADAGRGYVIYRATGDKLWKMFDSLGAE